MSQLIPYFGRAWSITIQPPGADPIVLSSSLFAEPPRVVISTESLSLMEYWKAEVTIYNLAAAVQAQLNAPGVALNRLAVLVDGSLRMGAPIQISAGYKNGTGGTFDPGANLIYEGNVLQIMSTRDNVVDSRVTIRCATNLLLNTVNHASASVAGSTVATPVTAFDAINQICAKANIQISNIDDKAKTALSAKKFARGQIFFDRPIPPLQDILKENNLMGWLTARGLVVTSLDVDPSVTPDFSFAPAGFPASRPSGQSVTRTLIGVPDQTQDGIKFRVLMDSRPQMGQWVQLLQGTAISSFPVPIVGDQPIQSPKLTYRIVGLTTVGDSRGRGNDWYTEITGLSPNFFQNLIQSRTVTNAQSAQ